MMHMLSRVVRRWLGVGVALLLSCCQAGAQLIVDLVQPEQVRRGVQAGTTGMFVRALGATDDQADAAEDIVSGARAAMQREVHRHLRQIRTGISKADEGYESEAQMVRAARAIEQGMIEDLRALAGVDQGATADAERAEAFERFQRERRRGALLGLFARGPCPMDFRKELARLKINVDGRSALEAALTETEKEFDAALVARGKAEQEYIKAVRAQISGGELERETRRVANGATARMARAQAVGWRRIVATLEPAELDALLVVRVRRWFEQYLSSEGNLYFGSDDTPATVREVLALELTPEQREAVLALLKKFEREYLEVIRSWSTRLDDATIANTNGNESNELFEPREKLRTLLEKDVLALLTDAQRQAYDVAPLVEQDTSWNVEDDAE